ncbi:hypothetical protein DFH06DRAFT_1178989 [Mycena polygramma]|nr:hypothetical protein DFH06DRAFT_1178989 [Mycena polygramma]
MPPLLGFSESEGGWWRRLPRLTRPTQSHLPLPATVTAHDVCERNGLHVLLLPTPVKVCLCFCPSFLGLSFVHCVLLLLAAFVSSNANICTYHILPFHFVSLPLLLTLCGLVRHDLARPPTFLLRLP